MKVAIFGTGYVGLVTAACLADIGHEMLCVDIAADRIAALNQRQDADLRARPEAELVAFNSAAGRLSFSTDSKAAVALRRA